MKITKDARRKRIYIANIPIPAGVWMGTARRRAENLVGMPMTQVPAVLGVDETYQTGTVTSWKLSHETKNLDGVVRKRTRVWRIEFEITDEELEQATAELVEERGGGHR